MAYRKMAISASFPVGRSVFSNEIIYVVVASEIKSIGFVPLKFPRSGLRSIYTYQRRVGDIRDVSMTFINAYYATNAMYPVCINIHDLTQKKWSVRHGMTHRKILTAARRP